MKTDTANMEKCFLCGGESVYLLTGQDYLYKTTTGRFPVYKCDRCGVERIFPMPSNSELMSFYPSVYYSYNTSSEDENKKGFLVKIREKIVEFSYDTNVKKDSYYFFAILASPFFSGLPLKHSGRKNFLDIGCGDGYNVGLMSRYGWNAYGFEVGEKKMVGNIYYDANFSDVDFGDIRYDYVRIWHVLEHVPDPKRFIEKLSTVVSDDAEIVIGVPNTRSLYAFLFGRFWYNRDIPRHVVNYNPRSLKLLLKKGGFTVKKLSYNGVGGFLGSIQHAANSFFGTDFKFIHNLFLVVLFSPLDIALNVMGIGDCISVVIKKNEKR